MASLAAMIAAFTVLVAGCVTVPTSGHVQAVNVTQGNADGGQYYLQPIPVPPGRNWTPQEIVSGFLAANASFANDHAVARQYLMPGASRSWHPGLAVTVFSQISSNLNRVAGRAGGQLRQTNPTTIVQVSGTVLGNLSNTGQYSISSRSQGTTEESFVLVKLDNQWRISSLPNQVLLLTQSDFVHVYQPRNIYFFDPDLQTLVPDPVYVPEEATPADLVRQLLRVLLATPSGWLRSAVKTAFPAGTHLLGVSLDGGTAVVNLGGAATGATDEALRQMSAQLLWTLAGSNSDVPSIQSVELEINGTPWNAGQDNPVQQIGSYSSYVPSAPEHASFYYTDSHGVVRSLSGSAQANAQGTPVSGQAGTGSIPLTQVAVSPDGRYVAGLGTGGVYTGPLARNGTLTFRANGTFTSLSWDIHDNLWAVRSGQVWLVPGRGGQAIQVGSELPAGEHVTALKVAPDGVRCAMLATGSAGSQLLLAAIAGSGQQAYLGPAVPISADNLNFTSLTWYGTDHVIALRDPSGHPVLDEVAVNGENITTIPATAGISSITADGSSNPLVAGLSSGQLTTLATAGGLWSGVVGTGRAPAYPG